MKLNEGKRNNCQSEGVYGETFFPSTSAEFVSKPPKQNEV